MLTVTLIWAGGRVSSRRRGWADEAIRRAIRGAFGRRARWEERSCCRYAGHTSSEMIQRYRRAARTAAELELGPLGSMAALLPECADTCGPLAVRRVDGGEEDGMRNLSGEGGIRALGTLAGTHDFQSSSELGSVDFPAESSPIPPEEEARGRATDSLLTALDLADQIARRLDLPRVRIRIANARREVPR